MEWIINNEWVYQWVERIALLTLSIGGLLIALARWKRYPRASRFVAIAAGLLLIRTVGLGAMERAGVVLAVYQVRAIAGILETLAFAVLFSAAFAFPNDQHKS